MKLTKRNKALVSVGLIALLFTSILPLWSLASGDVPPDLSGVALDGIEEEGCLTLDVDPALLADQLAGILENATQDPSGTTGVPTLCGTAAEGPMRDLILAGNAAVQALREVLAAVDAAIDENAPIGDIPFLYEDFRTERIGGIGDWDVRTNARTTGWREPIDPAVTTGFALTDSPISEYEHGLNTTLISPAIDLGGAAVDPELVQLPAQLRAMIEARLGPASFIIENVQDSCFIGFGFGAGSFCFGPGALGDDGEVVFDIVTEVYLQTTEDLLSTLDETIAAATLDVRHRFNLANGLDGVRYEVLTEEPPVEGLPPVGEIITPRRDSQGRGHGEVASINNMDAFTGDSETWAHETFDLTPFAGQRIWIVLRARTSPAFGFDDFFRDEALFARRADLGFALGGLFVNATAEPENLRILDIDGGQVTVDGRETVAPPLAGRTIDVVVTNQGRDPEDAVVTLEQCRAGACTGVTLGSVFLLPGEVASLATPYPDPSIQRGPIELRARISPIDAAGGAELPLATEGALLDRDDDRVAKLLVERITRLDVRDAPGTTLGLDVEPARGLAQESRTVTMRVRNTGNVRAEGRMVLSITDAETGVSRGSFAQDGLERLVDLAVGRDATFSWSLAPAAAGIYRVEAQFAGIGELARHEVPRAHVFVERTAGVVCFDDLDTGRACGTAWAHVTDLPDGVGTFGSAAIGPDGRPYALTRSGQAYLFEGDAWKLIGDTTGGRRLVATDTTLLSVGSGVTVEIIEPGGIRAAAPVPLDRVDDVAVDAAGRAVLAGPAPGGIGVAVGDGLVWDLFSSPDALLGDGSVRVTGVAPMADGRYALSLLQLPPADGVDGRARACVVDPTVPDLAVNCVARVLVPRDVAGRRAEVDIGTVGNWTVLLVESPRAADLPPSQCKTRMDAGVQPGLYCAFRVVTDELVDEPIRPIPFPEQLRGVLIEPSLEALGGSTWLFQDPAGFGETESPLPLYRLDLKSERPAFGPATLPTTDLLRALGGGARDAAAVTKEEFLELRGAAAYLSAEGDWENGYRLGPQVGASVWSSVRVVGHRFAPPPADEVLRGTCGRLAPPTTGVPETGGLAPCIELAPENGLDDPELDEPEWVNLTLRYTIRDVGRTDPEVRILLEPGVTQIRKADPSQSTSFLPGDQAGGIDLGELAQLLYVRVEETLNGELPFFQFLDERDTVADVAPEEEIIVHQPQIVHVAKLAREPSYGWKTVTLPLKDVLAPYTLVWGETRLLGIEIVFPRDSEMAVDVVWLNATMPDEVTVAGRRAVHNEVLLTTGGGPDIPEIGRWSVYNTVGPETSRPPAEGGQVRLLGLPRDLQVAKRPSALAGLFKIRPWHPAERTERPAWAFMGDATTDFLMPGEPNELNEGVLNSLYDRLVTPVIDLREATRPVMSIRHAYAFPDALGQNPADGVSRGWVEAQVETAPGVWSQFETVHPKGGYPDAPDGAEWADLVAFWGTNVERDPQGQQGNVLAEENWEEARFELYNQSVPLIGKRVRFAFTAFVIRDNVEADRLQYEGWVVADLRVAADETLAVDLALTGVRVSEGYDVLRTGLAPGSSPKLNVTLQNLGRLPTQGGLLRWELVGVTDEGEEPVLARGATGLAQLEAGRTTWVDLPITVPTAEALAGHGAPKGVARLVPPIAGRPLALDPELEMGAYLRVRVDPAGTVDEDPSNNARTIGNTGSPLPLRLTPGVEVRLSVTPQIGSPERVRTLDLQLVNTGNVPLTDIRVNRTIAVEQGAAGRLPILAESRSVDTTRVLPGGEVRTLAALAPSVPVSDRLWLPGRDGSFVVTAEARATVGEAPRLVALASRADVPVSALDPYLRATVEDPTTGIGVNGEIAPTASWRPGGPGVFDSPKSLQLRIDRNNVSDEGEVHRLELPTVDISPAKFATVSFFHKYVFEEGFDGGRLEASTDGGATWSPLRTTEREGMAAYGDVLGGSPLASDQLTVPAFTGNSSAAGIDGWVLSTFNLNQLKGLTEPGEVEAFDMESMGGASTLEVEPPPAVGSREKVYTNPTWARGSVASSRVFFVENLTEDPLGGDRGGRRFLYTGSYADAAKAGPDGELQGKNAAVKFDIGVPAHDPDETVVLDWWEWAPLDGVEDVRQDENAQMVKINWARYMSSVLHPPEDESCGSTEFPVGPLELRMIETDGAWRHYEVDVTEGVNAAGDVLTLVFAWEPFREEAGFDGEEEAPAPWIPSNGDRTKDHPGIVVDGMRLRTFRLDRAGEVDVNVAWEERWSSAEVALYDDAFADALIEAGILPGALDPDDDIDFDGTGTGCRLEYFAPGPVDPVANEQDLLAESDEVDRINTTWEVVALPSDAGPDVNVLATATLRKDRPRIFESPGLVDARVVLPALDLGLAGGDEFSLSFDHLAAFYAFDELGVAAQSDTDTDRVRAGGGVVEVSVFDPLQGKWGGFRQLYAKPEQVNNFTEGEDEGDAYDLDITGGYGARLTVLDRDLANPPINNFWMQTLPFEPFEGDPATFVGDDSQAFDLLTYAYNSCIEDELYSQECSAAANEWTNESFDLSSFKGQKVRLAFHVYTTGWCSFENGYLQEDEIEGDEQVGDVEEDGCPDGGERWLVDNVTVTGRVFAGLPVQLRLAAGLDGSVHEAQWLVDEVEVQGTAYRRNVGVYVDDRPEDVGPGASTIVRGEVRNLGIDVRRDLALKATFDAMDAPLTIRIGDTEATERRVVTSDAFSMAASSSIPFEVELKMPERGVEQASAFIDLALVQFNEALGVHTDVPGEEVRTNDRRSLPLEVHTEAAVAVEDIVAVPARVEPGATSLVTLMLENPSPVQATLTLQCTARRILGWEPVAHGQGAFDEPRLDTDLSVPCEAREPTTFPLRRAKIERSFEVTVPREGAYLVAIEVRDLDEGQLLGEAETLVWSGGGPLRLFEDFEGDGLPDRWSSTRENGQDSWMWEGVFGESGQTTTEAAKRNNFSTFTGIDAFSYDQGDNYQTSEQTGTADESYHTAELITPRIDLHNVTVGAASLTFFQMARFAYGDGADVSVRVLEDEAGGGFTDWCKLEPVGGYDGFVASWHSPSPPARDGEVDPDANGGQHSRDYSSAMQDFRVMPRLRFSEALYTEPGFFGSTNDPVRGPTALWHDDWAFTSFPLHTDPTPESEEEAEERPPLTCPDDEDGQPLLGRTVQFKFALYTGEDDDDDPGFYERDPLVRGRGQGWFLDSVVVVSSNVTVEPREIRAVLLDNATKRFPVLVTNNGSATEIGRVDVDLTRSTIDAEQVRAGTRFAVEPNASTVATVEVRLPRDPLALPFRHTVAVAAAGLLDPNQVPSSIMRLDFDPRVWPDLSATILDPSEAVIEGVPAIIPVQVTNHGRAIAKPTSLVFRDTFAGETTEVLVQLPAIPPPSRDPLAAQTVVFVPWTPARGSAGVHSIEVVLDPENDLEEFTKHDNVDARTLVVAKLLIPDLRFDEANITLTATGADLDREDRGTLVTYHVTAGTLVTLSAPVENAGTSPATNVDVRLFVGPVVLPAKRVSRLEPGAGATVSFTFLAQEGTFPLTLEATSSSRDAEPEDNLAPLFGAIRLIGSHFRIEAEISPLLEARFPGILENVTLTLENRGALGALLDLRVLGARGVSYEPEADQVFLGATERVTIPGRVVLTDAADGGVHTVVVEIIDHDTGALATSATLGVHLLERHDLDVRLAQDTLLPGPTTMAITLDNRGNLPEVLTLRPVLDGVAIGGATLVTVPRDAQRSLELALDVPSRIPPGAHVLDLDLNGTLVERYSFDVGIEALARPFVTALVKRQAFGPQGLVVPIAVENRGNQPFTGVLALDPEASPPNARVTAGDLRIPAGEDVRVELTVPATDLAPALEGERLLATVLVKDASGASLASEVVVLPTERPDALILRHVMDPAEPLPNEQVRLTVTVGNVGAVAAQDVPVELFIDDEFAVRGTVPSLTPGDTRSVTFEWPAFQGTHVATVVVDPGSRVPDEDAANNAVSLPMRVASDASAIGRLVEGIREAPGPGLLPLLAALALALGLVAARARRDRKS